MASNASRRASSMPSIDDDVTGVRRVLREFAARGVPSRHRSRTSTSTSSAPQPFARTRRPTGTSLRRLCAWPVHQEVPTRSSRGRTWSDALVGGAPRLGWALAVCSKRRCRRVGRADAASSPSCLIRLNRFPRARRRSDRRRLQRSRVMFEAMAQDEAGSKRAHPPRIIDPHEVRPVGGQRAASVFILLAAPMRAVECAQWRAIPWWVSSWAKRSRARCSRMESSAHRLLAFDAPGVVVHAMHEEAAARITRRTTRSSTMSSANVVIPMVRRHSPIAPSSDCSHELIAGIDADAPSRENTERVVACVMARNCRHSKEAGRSHRVVSTTNRPGPIGGPPRGFVWRHARPVECVMSSCVVVSDA